MVHDRGVMALRETPDSLARVHRRSGKKKRTMTAKHCATGVGPRSGDSGRDDLGWLFDTRPEARVAIHERLERFPEYGAWMQGLASGVLHAVERESLQKA